MSIARVYTIQPQILDGTLVTIDADLSSGLHSFTIVGLAGKAVDESKDRVSSAIKHSGFQAPKSRNFKITISLSPADLKKEGPLFDLPIAIAYLIASGEVTAKPREILIGELALDGSLRPVRGVLNVVQAALRAGYAEIIVPTENAQEAALVAGATVYPASSLSAVITHLTANPNTNKRLTPQPLTSLPDSWTTGRVRLEDIRGQESAKRALVIAAAGRHNVLLVGPPGTGKTMLARAFQSLLPPLTREEALEVTAIHSLQQPVTTISTCPPFRAPHHTASHTALVGGGTNPKPGEVTLAHRGVLFMDEFPEFERRSLDALRQPLEDRIVSIARIQGSAVFPADFVLIAALNPYREQENGQTDLIRALAETYKGRVSGPILDRIDLWVEVPHVSYQTLQQLSAKDDETENARTTITTARDRQAGRLHGRGIHTNSAMSSRDLNECVNLTTAVETLLRTSAERLNLSPRGYHRLIKVARTIADLENQEEIEPTHVMEALQYRVPNQL